ncbi:fumarylacetoacetase [Microdochium nivale]|nr:fumarylacetoacetase [Microdochium nivale]
MSDPSYAHHFSERNIPFGIGSSARFMSPQPVTRLQNTVISLSALHSHGFFSDISAAELAPTVLTSTTLNQFAALPKNIHRAVQQAIRDAYSQKGLDAFPEETKENLGHVTLHLPVQIGDFTDFSCSLEHVKNAGRIIINDANPPPAFFQLPLGYQGRSSSILVSGTEVERPIGQFRSRPAPGSDEAVKILCGPSKAIDYEVELAAIVGKPLPMRKRLDAKDAEEHIFGYALLNDWSARDIQGFEMMPLGPLNGKAFGTTISPWIVTLDALRPHKASVPQPSHAPDGIPSYLQDPDNSSHDITIRVEVLSGKHATVTGTTKVKSLYWTPKQMLAHLASSGTALRTGDVAATGTVSGETRESLGCILEATNGGTDPLKLTDGTERRFLLDGDSVRLVGWAGGEDSGVGFGECIGELVPARPL